jgi:hypothetical protein
LAVFSSLGLPFVAGAALVLFVEFPEYFGFFAGDWGIPFGFE